MKKGIIILFAATLGLAACNNYKKGPGGLMYQIHKDGGNEKIKEGDIVKLNFTQKNERDSIMFSTYDIDQAQIFPVGKKVYAGDMNDVLYLFGEGDSATFKLNLDTMAKYSGQPKPPTAGKDTYLVFTVKVEKVLKKAANEADSTFQKKAQEFFQKDYTDNIAKIKGAEAGKIKTFVDDNKLKTQTTASGLQYVIITPGSAQKAVLGDTLMLKYTGKLLTKASDGSERIFDTTDEKIAKAAKIHNPMAQYVPRAFTLGAAIPGFDEGIQLIGKGGKIHLIIPSLLAYGESGNPQGKIAPFSPLSFEVEIVDIKKPTGVPAAPVAPPVPTAPVK
ncbi:FKBP-type peptidyl-prolyl cis-trans isomerase [Pedobacter metabolipauper]|uniref:peptidylprolyl isomerase n=1 Tax=Pedobacter metabolipauper TaxID=425513 RepID=A0A4R6SRS9_9SPHI|nr:FKBP-type peptidyl-prolyl cis-trans isomerase [Pedobacter metabolipauper]TDQ07652.1 FKBP-type peptidyl-prolyl cis-trans isomerase [Pedobacter metabolipauper]